MPGPIQSLVLDISRSQGRHAIRWARVREAGYTRVIVQLSQGGSYGELQRKREAFAAEALRQAKEEGINHRGVYHFAHPRPTTKDAQDEAAIYCAALEKVKHLLHAEYATNTPKMERLPFQVLDYELFKPPSSKDPQAIQDWIDAFAEAGAPFDTIYTGIRRAQLFTPALASKYKLWVARYPWKAPKLPVPTASLRKSWEGRKDTLGPWDRAVLWQFTSGGAVPGISGRVDVNTTTKGWA